jgi:energy-coupling factor transporter ATP-binding protein EcfA2
MIDSLKIINLPHDKSTLKVWMEFKPGGKNMLFIWDNGVGKTTFLRAFHDSLVRNRDFRDGKVRKTGWVFDDFTQFFSGNSWKITGDIEEDDRDGKQLATDDEKLEAIERAFEQYFGENIIHLFHSGIPSAPEKQVLRAITEYVTEEVAKMNDGRAHEWDYSNVFDLPDTPWVFMNSLRLYAKKYKIPLEKLYWGIILMIKGAFSSIETEATSWWYIVPKAKSIASINKAKIIVLLDGENIEKTSLWERTMRAIDMINPMKNNELIILDEPTNGLALEKARSVRSKVLGVTWSQVFAASQNERLIEDALVHPNWQVVELPLKK